MFSLNDLLQTAYGLEDCIVSPIERGTMNQCFRVDSKGAIQFLKSYATRFYQSEQILKACEVQSLVHRAGLPTPAIIVNNQASAVTIMGGGFYVLNEFVAGHEYAQGGVPEQAAYQMGVTLARLQELLTNLGDHTSIRLPDPTVATDQLQRLLALAEKKKDQSGVDAIACHLLRYKIEALHRHASLFAGIREVPAQWVHGDYQTSNLVFGTDGQVRAILDFDQLQRRPRGLETMRALAFSFSDSQFLEQPGLSFFQGYSNTAGLEEAEVRLLAPLWTYYWLIRPWPLDVRYERPEDYDARWDALVQPPSDWWEQNMAGVTERYLEMLKTPPANR